MTKLPWKEALLRINKLLSNINFKSCYDPHFKKWRHDCLRTISKIEGEKAPALVAFEELDFEGNSLGIALDDDVIYHNYFRQNLSDARAILLSIQESIQEEISLEANVTQPNETMKATLPNKKVFVVHGHDEKLKTQVEQFFERLELEPIILHKQPDQGQTIIEKFEKHSDVSFAVVLLTPDDEGRKVVQKPIFPTIFDNNDLPLKPRARQNVIFEFGYFIGKLGRSKVCGLYCKDVELHSDYDGVLYTEVDNKGAWQLKLVTELKAAGFDVDANRLI